MERNSVHTVKLVLAGILMIIQSFTVHSQSGPVPESKTSKKFISAFEIIGGPNHSWFWGDEHLSDRQMNVNYTLGVNLIHDFTNRIGVGLMVFYQGKGNKRDYNSILFDDPSDPEVSHNYRTITRQKLDYFTWSIRTILYLDRNGNLFINVGPYVGYLIKLSEDTEVYREGSLVQKNYSTDASDFLKVDFGLSTSLGYKFGMIGNFRPTIQIQSEFGCLNIRNPELPAAPLKNNAISILIGIHLKK